MNDDGHLYHQHVEEENYFVSMTDMMVGLVFIFIILLMYFALQFRQTTDELTGANKTRTELLQEIKSVMDADPRLARRGVKVQIDPTDGLLRLPDEILFDSGKDQLKPEGIEAVAALADALVAVAPCNVDGALNEAGELVSVPRPKKCPTGRHAISAIYIEGHTDKDRLAPTVRLQDNWDLSAVRATNTYREISRRQLTLPTLCSRFLADNGAKGDCMPVLSVSGYGPGRPAKRGDDAASKQTNRRIDVRFLMVTPTGAAR